MNNKISKLIAIILLLLGFAVPTAYAAGDFTLTTDMAELQTCPSQFVPFEITVTNTGNLADTYTISKSGTAASWTLISPPGFVLQPQASQEVIAYMTPSKIALPGTYLINLNVASGSAGTKSIQGSLKVTKCHNVDLTSKQTTQDICSGSSESFSFDIANTGLWTESYEISVFGLGADWATLDKELVQLKENEKSSLTLTVSVPEGKKGAFPITVTAKSKDSGASQSLTFSVNAQSCYDSDLSVQSNYYAFCENSEAKIPIKIKNIGTSADTYNLKLTGPQWASLDKTRMKVNGNSEDTLNLILTPGYGIQGISPIKITAESQNVIMSRSIELNANVLTCYGVSLKLDKESDTMCPGTINSYEVLVTNTGNFTESYTVRARGASWIKFDESFIILRASESKTLTMTLEPTLTATSGKYMINVAAEAQKGSKVSASEILDIALGTKDSCFGVKVIPEVSQIKVAYGEGALVPISIENTGSQEVNYKLDVSGNGAVFTQLNPATINLKGNGAGRVYLYISVPTQTESKTYDVTISASDAETGAITGSGTIQIILVEEGTEQPALEPTGAVTLNVVAQEKTSLLDRIRAWLSNLFKPKAAEVAEEVVAEKTNESLIAEEVTEQPQEEPVAQETTPTEEELAAQQEATETTETTEETTTPAEENAAAAAAENEELLKKGVPPINVRPQTAMTKLTDYLVNYWYIVIILAIIVVLIMMIIRAGLIETTDMEAIFKEEKKPKTRISQSEIGPKSKALREKEKEKEQPAKKEQKGAWQKFKVWLEEEEPEPAAKEKEKEKPVKKKEEPRKEEKKGKEGKGAFQKFKDWLEEE